MLHTDLWDIIFLKQKMTIHRKKCLHVHIVCPPSHFTMYIVYFLFAFLMQVIKLSLLSGHFVVVFGGGNNTNCGFKFWLHRWGEQYKNSVHSRVTVQWPFWFEVGFVRKWQILNWSITVLIWTRSLVGQDKFWYKKKEKKGTYLSGEDLPNLPKMGGL